MTATDKANDYLESSAEWRCRTAKRIIRDLITEADILRERIAELKSLVSNCGPGEFDA